MSDDRLRRMMDLQHALLEQQGRAYEEFARAVFASVQGWLAGGAVGPSPLHELVEPEAAPACLECGGDADTCRHAFDDQGVIT